MSKLLADVIAEWGASAERCEISEDKSSRRSKGNARSTSAARLETLAQTIEGEVIPRLMLAHRVKGLTKVEAKQDPRVPAPEDIAELVRLVLDHDRSVALSFVKTLKDRGIPSEALYLELLSPAARLLGEMWKADLCDFTDVTVGLSRLQQLLHEFTPAFSEDELPPMTDKRVLLMPIPGEQHTFGIMVVEEFFRRAGWNCCTAMPQSQYEINSLVKRERFDVVGVSVSCEVLLEHVRPCIEAIRKASKNKKVTVLLGGPIFLEKPTLATGLGADGTAEDGRHAVLQLRSVFDRSSTRLT